MSLYKLIIMVLIIDAKNTFGDELKGNISFATDFLDQYGIDDIDRIIKHSIKFMRILNNGIINKGTNYNTSGRFTYRGVANKAFNNAQVGEIYRIITWCRTTEDKVIAEGYRK